MTMKSLAFKGVLLMGAILLLNGCSASSVLQNVGGFLTDLGKPRTSLDRISIVSKSNANNTSATAIDVIFVYNAKVNTLLPKSAAEWFTQRDELHANLWQYIDIASVQIPPSYVLEEVPLPKRYSTAVKVVAYANYLNKKGRKPIELTDTVTPLLTLEQKTILFSEQSKGK